MTSQGPASSPRSNANRLRCLATMRVLQRYLDGTLDERRARHVADHLEACHRCGVEAEVFEEIKTAIAQHQVTLGEAEIERLRRFGERLAHAGPAYGERGD